MVNAGKGEGSIDMANMLKPALARGELQLVGATTLDEYRLIEKDKALARRLQTVYVAEPTVADTLSILRGLKTMYELHHSIRIRDEALVAATTLSDRYLTDRRQPDKSIDLIDEACSRLRLEQESKPNVIWQAEQELLTRQIELSALDNEAASDQDAGSRRKDTKLVTRQEECRKQLTILQDKVALLTKEWESEKKQLQRVQHAKEKLEQAKTDMESARRRGDYSRAAELLHGTIPELERTWTDLVILQDQMSSSRMLEDAVNAEAIASIVSRQTGIPVSRLVGGDAESTKLLRMEDELRKHVVGQDHALTAVSNCVRLSRTRLQDSNRTLGNFLFLGPTGVGKTLLAKALAEFVFDDPHAMTRIDMSEYGEKHTVSRLIGAPPGYIGYDQAGILTESVRRRPYQILLLDEFEKAHRDVWNVLLQLFDEGHLTDAQGYQVDFRNVIVIMTSNLGASEIAELPEHLRGSEPVIQDALLDVVRHNLSPELYNRIDETVIFNRLQREHMDAIAAMGIREIALRLMNGQNMTLDVSANVMSVLAEMGYDVRYGARPLKRAIARNILNPLSRLVLEGGIVSGDFVQVKTRAEAMHLQKQKCGTSEHGWICASELSNDKNDIVILRNHRSKAVDGGDDDHDGGINEGVHL